MKQMGTDEKLKNFTPNKEDLVVNSELALLIIVIHFTAIKRSYSIKFHIF